MNSMELGRLAQEIRVRLQHAAVQKEASDIQTVDACMFVRFLRGAELEPLLIRIREAIKESEVKRNDVRMHP